jgi:hypothetical protein
VADLPLGGVSTAGIPAGSTVVTTLSLDVAGVPGTYELTFADGTFSTPDYTD